MARMRRRLGAAKTKAEKAAAAKGGRKKARGVVRDNPPPTADYKRDAGDEPYASYRRPTANVYGESGSKNRPGCYVVEFSGGRERLQCFGPGGRYVKVPKSALTEDAAASLAANRRKRKS